jgi:hypothetical protein
VFLVQQICNTDGFHVYKNTTTLNVTTHLRAIFCFGAIFLEADFVLSIVAELFTSFSFVVLGFCFVGLDP